MADGDIRVLLALDLVLSLLFSAVVVWGLDFLGMSSFTPRNVALGTILLAAVTYVLVLRQ
ncbi:MAG: hypothetical protein ABEJ31_10125 [Haloarculaceae archaeon]